MKALRIDYPLFFPAVTRLFQQYAVFFPFLDVNNLFIRKIEGLEILVFFLPLGFTRKIFFYEILTAL